MSQSKTIVIDKGYKDIKKEIIALSKEPKVAVGIVESKTERESREAGNTSSIPTNAQIGSWHEFGRGHNHERSFMRAGLADNQQELNSFIDKITHQIMTLKISSKKALGLLGQLATTFIKKKITSGLKPDLDPNYAKRKGKKKNKPLIDTGQLLNSITYEVRD